MIKSKRMQWAEHKACSMNGGKRNAYRILVRKPEGKRPQGRPRCRWEDNIVTWLSVTIGRFGIDNLIYCTFWYNASLHFAVHYYTLVSQSRLHCCCLVAASNGGRSPSSEFPNGARPQLPASNSHSSRLNPRSPLTTVKVMLQLTVSRPVFLGVKHPFGTYNQIFFLSDSCRFVDVGRPLWREDRSDFYNVQYTFYIHWWSRCKGRISGPPLIDTYNLHLHLHFTCYGMYVYTIYTRLLSFHAEYTRLCRL
jgi:hypothetical protein